MFRAKGASRFVISINNANKHKRRGPTPVMTSQRGSERGTAEPDSTSATILLQSRSARLPALPGEARVTEKTTAGRLRRLADDAEGLGA